MSMSQDHFFETALSLPQADRADLAFLLLQSLDHPGENISSAEYGAELRRRVEAYRRGELESFSLDEARTLIQQRRSTGPIQ
jgi:putative addiction module component (TIGR02574 family)